FVHRGLTLSFAIVVSALPAGLLVAAFWPRLLTHLDARELALVLGAIGIVTVLIPVTREVANRLLDRYVYRTHANDRRTVGEVERERDAAAIALCEQLTQANWALLLPVLSEDTLIAMIAVGPKLSGDPFYQEDLDLLMTLANQAGIAIKNAQLYAAVVVANEYLENIVATLESGVVAINAGGQVTMFNRAAEHLTGLPAEHA